MENLRIAALVLLTFQMGVLDTFGIEDSARTYIIRDIRYSINPVFPGDGDSLKAFEKAANRLHKKTKQEVFEREIVLSKNTVLNPHLVKETERKLRRFDFLGSVEVLIDTLNSDSVDLIIQTTDQWSTIPSIVVESGGGLIGLGAGVEEFNLLGRGKNVYFEAYNESDVGTTYSADYFDPQLFGSRWKGYALLSYGPLTENYHISVYNPRHSSSSKWAYGVSAEYEDEKIRLFYQGLEYSRIRQLSSGIHANGAFSFGERYRKKKISLYYRLVEDRYEDLGDETNSPLPDNELVSVASLGFSTRSISFREETRIDHFKRIEDITLGRNTSIIVGRSGFPIPIGIKRWEFSFNHTQALAFSHQQYLFLLAGFRTKFDINTYYNLDAIYYNRLNSWNTLGLNVEFVYTRDLQASKQILLGGDNGLRGYKAREFSGDKMLVVNLEDRIFSNIEIFTIALGGVVFLDAGYAWGRDEAIDPAKMKYSIGCGLRLGYTKSPGSPVVRFDVGWPLGQKRGPGFTLGVDQQF